MGTETVPMHGDGGLATAIACCRGVVKRFGGTLALGGIDWDLEAGEVHALCGANGAGKSTLSRVLSGHIRADDGAISVEGRVVAIQSPRDAMAAGIAMVTQETSLAPDLPVLENIFLPELGGSGRLSFRRQRERAEALIADLALDPRFSLKAIVRDLSMADRQLVEILKVLALDARVILFDEPTTSLSPYEADKLFDLMRRLAEAGKGLVLVSHRMEEIFGITNRVTVLREGRLTAAGVATASLTQGDLVRLMVGRDIHDVFARGDAAAGSARRPALAVDHLRVGSLVRDVSFTVGAGEILGLGGLVGSGRSETCQAIFGLTLPDSGALTLFGEPYRPRSPLDAIRRGFGFVGEDRRRQGLVPDLSVRENLSLVQMALQKGMLARASAALPAIGRARELGLAEARLAEGDVLTFSSGMQQKVIFARWLAAAPRVLILDEPTRGVDIETRGTIYAALRDVASRGTAVILVSSDFEELLGLADRVVVLSDGVSVADVPVGLLGIETLTMLAAPRSSADRLQATLAALVARWGGTAFWVLAEEGRLFCFDRVGDETLDIGLSRGSVGAIEGSPLAGALAEAAAPCGDGGFHAAGGALPTLLVPFEGRRNHKLGYIGLTLRADPEQPDPAAVRAAVAAGVAGRAPADRPSPRPGPR